MEVQSNNMKHASFYLAFEEKHRGSRALIKKRLEVYLPFLKPLKMLYSPCRVLDLGCGRGEWLELMRDYGFEANGIDMNDDMITACQDRHLSVNKCDAITYLKSLPDASYAVISAFHVVEHIDFSALQELVYQAHRVLLDGGLLMLETPNPENIKVSTTNFYLDPTHQRPIPPLLLNFLGEYYGFVRTKILRLNGKLNLDEDENVNIREILEGVSPDFALIAQKKGNPQAIEKLNPIFAKKYGIELSYLTNKYDQRHNQIENEIKKIYQSKIWRINKLLDRLFTMIRIILNKILQFFNLIFNVPKLFFINIGFKFINRRNGVFRTFLFLASYFKKLTWKIISFSSFKKFSSYNNQSFDIDNTKESLSTSAAEIYEELKNALEKNRKESR